MKKKFLFISALIFFVILLPVFAQNTQTEMENVSIDESAFKINSTLENSTDVAKEPSTFWLFFRMIFVLVFVVVCIFFVMYFMKKKLNPQDMSEDAYLRKTASLSLVPGKSVHIITLNDKAYLLGVSENSVSLITEITDKDFVDAMNINAEVAASERPKDFGEILEKIIPGFKNKKYEQNSEAATQRMKKHHSRLSKMNGDEQDEV
ncbi:MAG: flagellar biosynthetic protein FliO [Treponema sp.]|nr:flagellar biosynthetic protein FliO [Treponema sp.]